MEYKKLILTKENGVATVTLNRPEVLNALDQELHVELHRAIIEVRDDGEVRVVVITGAGRAFCSGRDVNQQARVAREGFTGLPRARTMPSGSPWDINVALWNLPKPVIAAVNGVAVGGGLSIVLASDIIIASEQASFGEFFIKRGLIASGCTTFLLPRMIGVHRAKELLFTGDLIGAREAERFGLVNHVYPADEFEAKVKELAEKLAKGPARALGLMKRLVNEGLTMNMESVGRAETLADDLLLAAHFEDFKEGVLSHVEKREPKFKGA